MIGAKSHHLSGALDWRSDRHRYFYGQGKLESSTTFLQLPVFATADTNYLGDDATFYGAIHLLCSMERRRKSHLPAEHKIPFPDLVINHLEYDQCLLIDYRSSTTAHSYWHEGRVVSVHTQQSFLLWSAKGEVSRKNMTKLTIGNTDGNACS